MDPNTNDIDQQLTNLAGLADPSAAPSTAT
jgi:hypothetical protein